MPSHDDNDIVGDLTKAELIAAVPPKMFEKYVQKLKWPQILDIVHGLPEEILDKIHEAAGKKEDEREQANNPLYVDIQISEDLPIQLPEDEVPEEIILVIHHESSDNIAIHESEGYVPVDDKYEDEVIPELQNQDGVGTVNIDAEGGNVIPLKFLGITDTELNKLLLNDLMKYALMNMDANEGGYAVCHSRDPVSDFA
ncbi:uncharacterized protein HD556DRAFT_1446298 [Suillus plorans]|uniref:Uncharacterized protein n=1 Tax=Suillus plorans TaxID=116603 RepID=A0A9P7DEM2_9AGAM|nr:uncharacterized protein HD556DRAFT_1446298 [Suillus plorans]KAG1790365.1 hypothetical protein HD556DRAFT_1446298 [Suillus plorans]